MPQRNRMKDPNVMMIAGCVALAVANGGQYLLHRNGAFPESIADGVSGFLFGVAIATLLLSIVLRRRTNGGGRCAS
jgi:hypothetical protein